MAKLNKPDIKQMAIDHGEKVVLGVVVLTSLLILYVSRWSGYDKTTPTKIESAVQSAREQILASEWPEEEKQNFKSQLDIVREAENLFRNVSLARYRYSTQMSTPLHRVSEKAREPKWKPLQNLIADSGRAVLAMQLSEEEDPNFAGETLGEDGEMTETGEPETVLGVPEGEDIDFAPRTATSGGGPGGFGQYEYDDPMGGGYEESGEMGFYSEYEEEAAYGMDYEEAFASLGEYGYDEEGFGSSYTPTEAGRGYRFVALRGVFPLREQASEIRNALSLPNTIPDSDLVDLIAFEIERKKAMAGPNPWSGEWETVDLEATAEVLRESARWETEVVEYGVTDPVITMPMPGRVVGYWGSRASHPDVENFRLSPEEQEREAKRVALIMKKYAELQENRPPEPVRKGGFYQMTLDIRQMSSVVSQSSDYQSFQRQINQELYTPEEIAAGLANQDPANEINATGHLLLFRFFDFTVEPGACYLYRVRLSLRNPNYGAPLDELVNPESAQGQIRNTPWAMLGKPVVISEDSQYFLTNVDDRGPTASLNIYEWYPETGTLINATLSTNLGQNVGGNTRTDVLRPAEKKFEEEEVEFMTDDVLVDVSERPHLSSTLHPDLQMRGRPSAVQGMLDRAVVIDRTGQFRTLDPVSRQKDREVAQAQLDRMTEAFKDLKQLAQAGVGPGISEYLELGGMSEEEYGAGGMQSRNLLRRRRGRVRSSTDMNAMMESMMSEGYPGTGQSGRPTRGRGRGRGR